MGRSKLEEILEECLSAYLEGRRTVEESLSLYPSLARELEPLLRTAIDVADDLGYLQPPRDRQEQARRRFLAAAARRRARLQSLPPAAAPGWGRPGLVALACVAIVAALALASATILRDSRDRFEGLGVTLYRPAPTSTVRLQPQLEEARSQLAALEVLAERGDPVEQNVIAELRETSSQIASQLADPASLDTQEVREVVSLATDQYRLLTLVRGRIAASSVADLEETLALTERMLASLGAAAPQPAPSPTAGPSPAPSPSPSPLPSPTAGPSPTASPSQTPQP